MAWVEGISRSSTILHDLAHILTHANKLPDNTTPDPSKNWKLLFPSPIVYGDLIDIADERNTAAAAFSLMNKPLSAVMPVVVRKLVPDGSGGYTPTTLVVTTDYTIDYPNGNVTILTAFGGTDIISVDYTWIKANLNNALTHITDRVVMQTSTTNAAVPEVDLTYGASGTSVSSIAVCVEFVMPRNLINPESNTPDYKDLSGLLRGTDRNRHYLTVRMFDNWDGITKAPATGALVSEWTKLAWFRDFHEILSTEAQGQPPTTSSRPFFTQTHIAVGLDDMPVQFWVRSDNNQVMAVLAGEASLDPANGLVSFFYLGQIDPVEVTEADVIGNFALISSSSTLPTAAASAPTIKPVLTFVDASAATTPIPGTTSAGYVLSYTTADGESPASLPYMYDFVVDRRFSLRFQGSGVPSDAQSIRLYRNVTQKVLIDKTTEKIDNYSVLGATTEYIFNHNMVTYDATWRVVIQREQSVPNYPWGNIIRFGPDYVVPVAGYLIDGNAIHLAVSEINSVPAITGPTGRFRVQVTTKIQDPSVRYGDGSAWELIFETTDVTTVLFTDTGLTGDLAFKPFLEGRPNPGVKRDINGRVTQVNFPTRWGPNTASGVLDIAMLKTKAGAPFQKHHPAFVANGKNIVMTALNPSRWTGKVHLSPVYVVHPYDGYRGKLRNVLVVPRKNLVHLDELIVDKGLPEEKKYRFFRINAPFSIFNDAPFPSVGVAIQTN